ncbi:MAG: hypothetical protein P4M14_04970 [Gammaproteobacteria bacterium]|nr:hypothetical protein [Gammaproteobacteria bacterium]
MSSTRPEDVSYHPIVLPSSKPRRRSGSQAQRYYSFVPDAETLSKPLQIPPGLYSFVQTKVEPKTVYLRLIVAHQGSAHRFFALSYVKMREKDIFTAGEMIINASGKIAMWSFRTGSFSKELDLDDTKILSSIIRKQPSKLDYCRLPAESFYFARLWYDYYAQGFTKCFFDERGRFRLHSDYSQITCDLSHGVPGKFLGMHQAVESIAIGLGAVPKQEALEQKMSALSIDVNLADAVVPPSAPGSTKNNSINYSTSFFQKHHSISLSAIDLVELKIDENVGSLTEPNSPEKRKSCFALCI